MRFIFAQNAKNMQRFCVCVGHPPLSCTVHGLARKLVHSCNMAIMGFAKLILIIPSRYPLPATMVILCKYW